MSYVSKHLLADEEVIFQTRIHWIVFVPWIVLTVSILSLLFVVRENPTYVLIIRVIASIVLLKAVGHNIIYWTAEYGVTSKRVLGKSGLLNIQSLDILLLKVEAVRLQQGPLGRILGYGDVIVTGTGGTQEILRDLPDPMHVRNVIQTQSNKVNNEAGNSSATTG